VAKDAVGVHSGGRYTTPDIQVLATGFSSQGARAKFRDTLAGRKREVWLTPMTYADTVAFDQSDIVHRLARGGLPPFFVEPASPERDFQEWLDAYWAKDVQELFRLEKRAAFARLFELLLIDSGGQFDASRFARACDVSRQTIMNYLDVLESTFVMHVVRPFATNTSAEIISVPRVYGFDTGFVAYHRGWSPLRRDDYGPLWEHVVLNELCAASQRARRASGEPVAPDGSVQRRHPMTFTVKTPSPSDTASDSA
jgi:uncharacterized protein